MNAWWQTVLFYDAPEYLNIVKNNSFLASLTLGHNPIHPVFNGLLWLGIHLFQSGNFTALIFGALSAWIVYYLLATLFDKRKSILGLVTYLLLPVVYIISTNLMVESVCLFLFVLLLFLLIKNHLMLYMIVLGLLVGTHIEALVWLPAIFAFLLFINHTKNLKRIFMFTLSGIILGMFFYWGQSFNKLFFARVGEHFGSLTIESILRMSRNVYLSLARGLGTLTLFVLIYIGLFKVRSQRGKLALALFSLSVFISGAVWTGDFMPRRLIFAAPIIVFLLVKYLNKWLVVLTAYLVPIFLFNLPLYLNKENLPPVLFQKMVAQILPSSTYLETHYVRPFIPQYSGNTVWLGENTLPALGSTFYLGSPGVFAPYYLYTGSNLHITSLAGVGKSELQYLFKDYYVSVNNAVSARKRIYTYIFSTLPVSNFQPDDTTLLITGKTEPGKTVFIYSHKLTERLVRERIDYGDVITWVGYILTGKRDPVAWAYGDKAGNYVIPVEKSQLPDLYVVQ